MVWQEPVAQLALGLMVMMIIFLWGVFLVGMLTLLRRKRYTNGQHRGNNETAGARSSDDLPKLLAHLDKFV